MARPNKQIHIRYLRKSITLRNTVIGKETFHGLKSGPDCYFDTILTLQKHQEIFRIELKKPNNNVRHGKMRGCNSSNDIDF